ncbi:UBP20-like protein [Mya arenaria]|uniref:ubiquitinyl hydrolase 1 n=1 Tax=Mya arenaria TaxID=6604 RepID=A0ABY7GAH8_MYAAR|nr:UBP20-like protein [Mya arenaria]
MPGSIRMNNTTLDYPAPIILPEHSHSHCLSINLSTLRIWCYRCESEVFHDKNSPAFMIPDKPSTLEEEMDVQGEITAENSPHHSVFGFEDSESEPDEDIGMHNDTQEFLRCFMDQLHEELKQPIKDNHEDREEESNIHEHKSSPVIGQIKKDGQIPMDTSSTSSQSDCDYETCDSALGSEKDSVSQNGFSDEDQGNELAHLNISSNSRELRSQKKTSNSFSSESGISRSDDFSNRTSKLKEKKDHANRSIRSAENVSIGTDDQRSDSGEFVDAESEPARGRVRGPGKNVQYRSVISDIFDGKLNSSVQCLTCERVSTTKETFQDLSLPIPSKDHVHMLHASTSHVAGQKLKACRGHYTAYCQNVFTELWYEFDDQYVTEVDVSQVVNCEAYVLFYRKRNDHMHSVRQEAMDLMNNREPSLMHFFVSKQWINRFNTFAEPGPITNDDFLCPHGGVPPQRLEFIGDLVEPLSQSMWEYLHDRFGGGPACNHLFPCGQCHKQLEMLRNRQKKELDEFIKLNERFKEEDNPSVIYAISMTWFKEWENFVREKEDREMWEFLYNIYGGGPELIIKQVTPPPVAAHSKTLAEQAMSAHANRSENANTERGDTSSRSGDTKQSGKGELSNESVERVKDLDGGSSDLGERSTEVEETQACLQKEDSERIEDDMDTETARLTYDNQEMEVFITDKENSC